MSEPTPDWALAPGAILRAELIEREMTQRELAKRMGRSEKHISQLMTGQVGLTATVALELEDVLGINAVTWLHLEVAYRVHLAREARK